jgi:hypothetical protein
MSAWSSPATTVGFMRRCVVWASSYIRVHLATLISGEDTANNRMMTTQLYTGVSISGAQAAAVAKGAAGVLGFVTVGYPGAASSTITIYDNASAGSGTVLAVIDGTKTGTFFYYIPATNGITAVSVDSGGDLEAVVMVL